MALRDADPGSKTRSRPRHQNNIPRQNKRLIAIQKKPQTLVVIIWHFFLLDQSILLSNYQSIHLSIYLSKCGCSLCQEFFLALTGKLHIMILHYTHIAAHPQSKFSLSLSPERYNKKHYDQCNPQSRNIWWCSWWESRWWGKWCEWRCCWSRWSRLCNDSAAPQRPFTIAGLAFSFIVWKMRIIMMTVIMILKIPRPHDDPQW